VINLDKICTIYKTPEIRWINNDFICISTFTDLSTGYDLFVPYKTNEPYIYTEKCVEETDTLNNNIVYIDTVTDKSMTFLVVNLITKKQKSFLVKLSGNEIVFPYYDSLSLTKNQLQLFFSRPNRKMFFDITK